MSDSKSALRIQDPTNLHELLIIARGLHGDAYVAYAYAIAAEIVHKAISQDDKPGDEFYEWKDDLIKCGDAMNEIWEQSEGIDPATRQAITALKDNVSDLIGRL